MIEAIGTWPGAVWLQQSGTAYLFVNAAHILGLGLLLGAIVPLDLRLLGLLRRFPLDVVLPLLTRCAGVGLALALTTGLWLFSVKPAEYLANVAFRWKALLLAAALINVAVLHGLRRRQVAPVALATRVSAAVSLGLWLGILVAGRWIGFL